MLRLVGLWFDSTAKLAVTNVEDTLTEGEKDELERAVIENERSGTKYGSGLPEGHRDDSDEV